MSYHVTANSDHELKLTHDDYGCYIDGHRVHFHHKAFAKGYLSRTGKQDFIEPYSGKFGTGYKVHTYSRLSSQYHDVSYYILATEPVMLG